MQSAEHDDDIGTVLMQNKLSYFDLFSLFLLARSPFCSSYKTFTRCTVYAPVRIILLSCLTFKYISIEMALHVKWSNDGVRVCLFSLTTSSIFMPKWFVWDAEKTLNISSSSSFLHVRTVDSWNNIWSLFLSEYLLFFGQEKLKFTRRTK